MSWRKLFGLLGFLCMSRAAITSFPCPVRLVIAVSLGLAVLRLFERPTGELLGIWLWKRLWQRMCERSCPMRQVQIQR
jgi:hypothetical protein